MYDKCFQHCGAVSSIHVGLGIGFPLFFCMATDGHKIVHAFSMQMVVSRETTPRPVLFGRQLLG